MEQGNLYYFTAFLLGALHSLEPGHGKTVIAAYMVGHRVRAKEAVLLGVAVTVAHTFSVLFLALFAQWLSHQMSAELAAPVLGVIGALLVVSMGVWMWFRSSHHHHHHDHVHVHGLEEGHGHTLKEMLGLGLSGGIVPCPAGVSLLLTAVAVGSVGRGVNLVLAFSAGIGVVVTGTALLLSKVRSAAAPFLSRFERSAELMPKVSAALVTAMGLWLLVHHAMELI